MTTRLPVLITFVCGWFLVAEYFIPHPWFRQGATLVNAWVPIVAAVGLGLGAISLFRLHLGRIRERHPHRLYSAVTLVSMIVTVVAGLVPGPGAREVFDWIYENTFVPLRATMFSLLALYLASAAYRAFRVRNAESMVLFLAGTVVMLGNLPAEGLLERLPGDGFVAAWRVIPASSTWLMDVPMTAALRAIKIGIGLGLVVLSLRILLGRDRSYLGGSR